MSDLHALQWSSFQYKGTRATGCNETYRCYTCVSRQRYGTKTCSADRLPADVLDHAIIESLLAAYEDSDLFRAAVGQAQLQARDGYSRHDDELLAVTNELAKVDASVDRHLRAFESGSMPEALCGERVKELATRATILRARHEELNEEMEQADIKCASPEELATIRDRVNEAISEDSPAVVKSLLQALIHEVRVDSRNVIQPIFRVPLAGDTMAGDAVRAPPRPVGAEVGAEGLEPPTC
ncbi:MAG TPA: recombinase zinc beta ribbon domain-containing protein [Acidimicrobiales bacterium]|nr:recombinase zinc beta ribbon domain-containing protein [Acidimicrobiales bacterium]